MKYEFTGEEETIGSVTFKRIRLVSDLPSLSLSAGDVGGWVEGKKNLSQVGSAWVSGNAKVYGDALVCGNAEVSGNAKVYGDALVCGNAKVYGDAEVSGNAWVSGNAKVCGDALVSGNAKV